ncbi:MAG: prolyl oligopeptidase family serine peptidase, partial [Actinomycetota bacterium]|nr:prolyl oligopeptidase family serine peptidase [Actinomycetota bacterium]
MAALAVAPAAPAAKKQRRVAYVADGRLAEWRGAPTYLAGRTQISAGELIYTDYLYDDYGPDLDRVPNDPPFRAALAPTNGDYRYPDDAARYGHNAADLRELRISATRGGLHGLIGLQTMKIADAAAAMIAIDTDGDAATGASEWPDGVGIATPGADRFVTVWGTGGHVVDASGRSTPVRTAANLEENAIEVDVPFALLGALSERARIWAVTGLARRGGGGFEPQQADATAVFNVAFRGDDDWPRLIGHWGEHEQSLALARGDVTEFAHPLHLGALRAISSIPFEVKPGFYNRIFRSKYDYGEGIDPKEEGVTGDGDPMFLSRWQPYGLYLPKGYDGRPAPLLLNGHSLDVNHNEYRTVSPNLLRQLGDERGSLIFTPLARGIDSWYLSAGFADVLEAWEDVKSHYGVDDERVSITGYSMGGYMTYRLGLLMPDRFARASSYVGPPAYPIWPYPLPPQSPPEWRIAGNANLLVENALNLPFEVVAGQADELVPITGVQKQVDDLLAAGTDLRFYRHLADDHFSIVLADRWERTRDFLGRAARDRAPVHVRYVRYPAMDLPRYRLRFDRAYWVSGVEVRAAKTPEASGAVHATTFGRGGHERAVTRPKTTVTRAGGGVSPALRTEQRVVEGPRITERNGFRARLRNLDAIRFDTAGMGLDPGRPITAELRGDGRTKLWLLGRFPRGTRAFLDGKPLALR